MVLCLKARESRSPPGPPIHLTYTTIAGWSSPVARQAHNLKVIGSNPIPATRFSKRPNKPPRRRQAMTAAVAPDLSECARTFEARQAQRAIALLGHHPQPPSSLAITGRRTSLCPRGTPSGAERVTTTCRPPAAKWIREPQAVNVKLLPVAHSTSFSGISCFARSTKFWPLQCIGITCCISNFASSAITCRK